MAEEKDEYMYWFSIINAEGISKGSDDGLELSLNFHYQGLK